MKRHSLSLCFVMIYLSVGCGFLRGNESNPQSQPPAVAETLTSPALTSPLAASATLTPLRTTTPTVTASIMATRTPTPTNTPYIPSEARLQFQCLEVIPTLSNWVQSSGVLILDNRRTVDGYLVRDDYLLDMSTGKLAQLIGGDESGLYFSVSPGRKLVAYVSIVHNASDTIVQKELVIASADGKRLITIPWEEGWVGIPGWLNDHQLVINISGLDPDESRGMKASTLLALDPFTGERQILRPGYPNIDHTRPMVDWEGWSVTKYDSDLTRVVYLTDESEFGFALWDLEQGKRLASLKAVFPFGYNIPNPHWSPDGSRFVVEAFVPDPIALELFLVSREGNIEQLTNLYQFDKARLVSHSWSPDGRYLAAWLEVASLRDQKEADFVIVDTQTKQIINYCLKVNYGGEMYGDVVLPPIWSPDGTQLIVQDWPERDHRRVILVDPARGFTVQIAEFMEPMGWMLAP